MPAATTVISQAVLVLDISPMAIGWTSLLLDANGQAEIQGSRSSSATVKDSLSIDVTSFD